MRVPYWHVDAFTAERFRGNPAGVCLLPAWPTEPVMQSAAAENNLSETAFLVEEGPGFRVRWFTPKREVDLCGHATLASAHVLFTHAGRAGTRIEFQSASGPLAVDRAGDLLVMDFPARPGLPCEAPEDLLSGLGKPPLEVRNARDYLAVYASERDVRSLEPDMARLARLPFGVIATAPGDGVDFVSRFFAPAAGVPEDPVTGSSHCTLVPYWAARLGRRALTARQVSARGGDLSLWMEGERVKIGGRAVTYLAGEIEL